MKNNHTDITLVLDRSGSMEIVRDSTLEGVNRFIAEQKAAPGTATFTLHQFDDRLETPVPPSAMQHVKPLDRDSFVPRGGTALLDALGSVIENLGKRLAQMHADDRPSKVIFVIVTDGDENASRRFSYSQVFGQIHHQREKYAWEFVYLGANQDAIATAANFGIRASHAMTYAHNQEGTQSAFNAINKNTVAFRCSSKVSMCFEPEDRAAQFQAGSKIP